MLNWFLLIWWNKTRLFYIFFVRHLTLIIKSTIKGIITLLKFLNTISTLWRYNLKLRIICKLTVCYHRILIYRWIGNRYLVYIITLSNLKISTFSYITRINRWLISKRSSLLICRWLNNQRFVSMRLKNSLIITRRL